MRNRLGSQQLQGVEQRLTAWFTALSQPGRFAALQRTLIVLLVIWSLHSLAQLFWVAWPAPAGKMPEGKIVNPSSSVGGGSNAAREPIEIEAALRLGLFGNPEAPAAMAEAGALTPLGDREGIEEGARDTRLALTLTGIVASTADGLGSAVIAAKNVESTYAVGDELPVQGNVTLAKVMPTQVVLDNNGTYELLRLFDETALDKLAAGGRASGVTVNAPVPTPVAPAKTTVTDTAGAAAVAEVASELREQLYDDPQSLAEVVQISAVRDENGLRGYRVAPGRNARQFKALGLRAGDVVTAVNGLPLSDPANTVRLYQMMREATDATFEIERDGGTTTLSVSLGAQP